MLSLRENKLRSTFFVSLHFDAALTKFGDSRAGVSRHSKAIDGDAAMAAPRAAAPRALGSARRGVETSPRRPIDKRRGSA